MLGEDTPTEQHARWAGLNRQLGSGSSRPWKRRSNAATVATRSPESSTRRYGGLSISGVYRRRQSISWRAARAAVSSAAELRGSYAVLYNPGLNLRGGFLGALGALKWASPSIGNAFAAALRPECRRTSLTAHYPGAGKGKFDGEMALYAAGFLGRRADKLVTHARTVPGPGRTKKGRPKPPQVDVSKNYTP